MFESVAPTSAEAQYAQRLARDERRIADLERSAGRFPGGAGAPAGTGANGDWYYDATNDRLYLSDGVGWVIMYEPLQTYVPTWANVTLGTGPTRTGEFKRCAGYCDFRVVLVLGTAGVLTGQPSFNLPTIAAQGVRSNFNVHIIDAGIQTFEGGCETTVAGSSTCTPYVTSTAAAFMSFSNINATTPMTWGVSDELDVGGRYRMNTPYL